MQLHWMPLMTFFMHLLLKCKKCVADKGDYTGMCICFCRLSRRTTLFDLICIIHAGTKHEVMFYTSAIYYQNLSMFGWNLAIIRGVLSHT